MASTTPQSPEISTEADRRAFPRVPVALPAFLMVDGLRHHIRLLDLSAGGAKLDHSGILPVGTAVELDCGTLRCAAVVRWCNAGAIGIRFDRELTEREVTNLSERSVALAARLNAAG
jgi:hypothetical protein